MFNHAHKNSESRRMLNKVIGMYIETSLIMQAATISFFVGHIITYKQIMDITIIDITQSYYFKYILTAVK